MPLSYQRKIHRGEKHPVTLHPCKRQEKLYLTEQRPYIPWIHLPSSGLVRIWSLGRSQQLFFCVFSHFRHGDDQTNEQPGDPSASLLLTSEKAVFCKNRAVFCYTRNHNTFPSQSMRDWGTQELSKYLTMRGVCVLTIWLKDARDNSKCPWTI